MTSLTSRLPERTLAVALLARATFLWLVLRAVIATFGVVTSTRNPWVLTIPMALVLIGMVGGLSLLDARRRNEHRFLANLGVSQAMMVVLSMTPALVAEMLVGLFGAR
jgi:membrane protein YdbS with pleckstrin-like domain